MIPDCSLTIEDKELSCMGSYPTCAALRNLSKVNGRFTIAKPVISAGLAVTQFHGGTPFIRPHSHDLSVRLRTLRLSCPSELWAETRQAPRHRTVSQKRLARGTFTPVTVAGLVKSLCQSVDRFHI